MNLLNWIKSKFGRGRTAEAACASCHNDPPVYLDVERMNKALRGPRIMIPPGLSVEEVVEFINRHVEQQRQEDLQVIRNAYKEGWLVCARWAHRDDLIYDIGTAAYNKDRDAALGL
jgi:hypothetical protein